MLLYYSKKYILFISYFCKKLWKDKLVYFLNRTRIYINLTLFCPRDRRSGDIWFLSCLSICQSHFFHYICLKLNFDITFWTVKVGALIFHEYFIWQGFSVNTNIFLPCVLDFELEFDRFFNFTIVNNFWKVNSIALIFHMSILWDKYQHVLPCDLNLDLAVWPTF